MRKNPTTRMSEFLFLRLSVRTYIVCLCVCVYRLPPHSPTLPLLWLSMQPQLWVTLPLVRTDWTTCTDPSLRYTYIHTYMFSWRHTKKKHLRTHSTAYCSI